MSNSKDFLLKIMRQLPSAPCYPYPQVVQVRPLPVIPQQPPGEWQARISSHMGVGYTPDPFKLDREALYGEADEKP